VEVDKALGDSCLSLRPVSDPN